jgi:tRNA(Ile)-lysidine synthase
MNVIMPKPGTYVIAVSGGVDSIVLLDLVHKHAMSNSNWNLIVAHLDHGIRHNSNDDRIFVQAIADNLGVPFVYEAINLGEHASEDDARTERYRFLRQVMRASNAAGLMTAHHQDDVIETAIINLVRGTGRKGVTALNSQPEITRPLIDIPKADLIAYAKDQGLVWREDSTNSDDTYLRNYIRHQIVPRFNAEKRAQLLSIITDLRSNNEDLDMLLNAQLAEHGQAGTINRTWFNSLPHSVAKEVLAAWLRLSNIRSFSSKNLEQMVVAAKTLPAGKQFSISNNYSLRIDKEYLALTPMER